MSFLTELSTMIKRAWTVTPETVFEYYSDADRIHVHTKKLPSFFDRFGYDVDINKIKIIGGDTIIIPVVPQIYKGTFSSKAFDKIKEELETHTFFDFIDYDTVNKEISITFSKNLELY